MSTPQTQLTPTAVALAQRFVYLSADGAAVDADSEAVVVIQDNHTGLQWGAKPLLDGQKMTHAECVEAAAACRLLDGTDWQLLSVEEFDTVKDLTRFEPAVNPALHRWPSYGWAWARNAVAVPGYSDFAWYVPLDHGYSSFSSRGSHGVALVCRVVPGAVPSPPSVIGLLA